MRFTTMDPMCEKYYHLSPYAYCGNNPVNAVDPSGMDIWDIDPNGQISNHIETEDFDKIRILNAKGSIIAQTENFIYGTISHQTIKHENGNYELFQIKGDSNGRDVFEALAQNTNVEWSLGQMGDFNGENILTTSHSDKSEDGLTNYLNSNFKPGMTIRELSHNHPSGNAFPSGFEGQSGDIQFARYVINLTKQHPRFNIYTLLDDHYQYIPYNAKSTINDYILSGSGTTLNEFIVKGRRKR